MPTMYSLCTLSPRSEIFRVVSGWDRNVNEQFLRAVTKFATEAPREASQIFDWDTVRANASCISEAQTGVFVPVEMYHI